MQLLIHKLTVKFSAVLLAVILSGVSSVSYGTDVYITRDKDGNPVFSDQPSNDAEKLIIEDIQIIPSERPRTSTSPGSGTIKELPKYNDLTIVSPKDDQTIRENTGALSIQLNLDPELRGKDVIKLYMDGKVVAEGRQLSFNLSNVDRGSHVLQAAVTSSSGKKSIQSKSITVHLQRISVNNNPSP